ncbi:hypothetical protein Bca52824_051287 [Brassica carinata]|uniref:Uncharacterized protein n=1 Tax=Brassica carinata TaxID=52824 RepID=A0A8X7UIJ2_BRACI|nr:hypothetical protein Bca52824_051287 [Brassica carinata]
MASEASHKPRTNTKKLEKASTTRKGGHEAALDHAPELWLTRPTTNLLSRAHSGEPIVELPKSEPEQPKRPNESLTV